MKLFQHSDGRPGYGLNFQCPLQGQALKACFLTVAPLWGGFGKHPKPVLVHHDAKFLLLMLPLSQVGLLHSALCLD